MIDSNKLNDIVNRIATKFDPDKIILFGSYASGSQHEDSDLDLLIIKDTDQPIQTRGFELRMSLIGTMIPFDILFYTNSEYEKEKSNSFSFLNSAMKNTKILYERAD
jgi:predicted nucleotidyltransferase